MSNKAIIIKNYSLWRKGFSLFIKSSSSNKNIKIIIRAKIYFLVSNLHNLLFISKTKQAKIVHSNLLLDKKINQKVWMDKFIQVKIQYPCQQLSMKIKFKNYKSHRLYILIAMFTTIILLTGMIQRKDIKILQIGLSTIRLQKVWRASATIIH